MALSDDIDRELLRVRIVLVLMLAAFLVLGSGLWRVQVRDARKYRTRFVRQSIRVVRLPGPRGRILDRNGMCLADNRPSYCIAVYVEELRMPGRASNTVNRVEQVVDMLALRLGLEREVTREDIENHVARRRALPLLVWRDIGDEVLARWQESDIAMPGSGDHAPGVAVGVEPVRLYPQGQTACHILGFTGRSDPVAKDAEDYDFRLPEVEGKYGVETARNADLIGAAGYRMIRVDASGFKHALVKSKDGTRDPQAGRDVVLAIDSRMQRAAESILAGQKGAAVLLDPRNGDVLALASSPGFDPNMFSPGIAKPDWDRMVGADGKPLLNRAVSEVYALGSIFKPVVAMAALVNGAATAATTYTCSGCYTYGRLEVNCWSSRGHGTLAMRKAIEQSCNVYFCNLGVACGHEAIQHTAEALGLGSKTGIEWAGLVGEARGLVPTDRWKRRVHGDKWRIADTCHLSIGQGAINATPLQMAVVAAALANGGCVYQPRLVLCDRFWSDPAPAVAFRAEAAPGKLVARMPWTARMLEAVKGGMLDVIESPIGTGKRARVLGVKMAGKTGTAEVGAGDSEGKDVWMLAFAPFEQPRYAVALVIEDGLSGGRTAAPLIKLLMEEVFKIEEQPAVTAGNGTGVEG